MDQLGMCMEASVLTHGNDRRKTVGQRHWWSYSSGAGTASPSSGLWLAVSVSHVLGCSPAVYCYFGGQHSPSKFGVWGTSDMALVSPKGQSWGDNSLSSQQVPFSRLTKLCIMNGMLFVPIVFCLSVCFSSGK